MQKLSKVSHLIRSNSGSIVLSNITYSLDVDGRILDGTTTDEGLVEQVHLPPGDHTLTMNNKTTKLSTLPSKAPSVVHIFEGFMLEDGLETAPATSGSST